MFCKVSNTVTYETKNMSFSIRDVGVFFPYQSFIVFLDSAINILVTKIVTSMTISIECMFGESLVFLLVMNFFFCMSSEIFHLGRMSRTMMTGLQFLVILFFRGCIFGGIMLTFNIFNIFMNDGA